MDEPTDRQEGDVSKRCTGALREGGKDVPRRFLVEEVRWEGSVGYTCVCLHVYTVFVYTHMSARVYICTSVHTSVSVRTRTCVYVCLCLEGWEGTECETYFATDRVHYSQKEYMN